jgi:DNA-binding response OmpR family regulator
MSSASLAGYKILLIEDLPVVALDVQTTLEAAGATVLWKRLHEAEQALREQSFSAAILDLRLHSDDHRPIARALRKRGVPFLFHSTHAPKDVTTVRGAPVMLKPAKPNDLVRAVALLVR